jgi:hypothetical protein
MPEIPPYLYPQVYLWVPIPMHNPHNDNASDIYSNPPLPGLGEGAGGEGRSRKRADRKISLEKAEKT